jgi:hypothetical protein
LNQLGVGFTRVIGEGGAKAIMNYDALVAIVFFNAGVTFLVVSYLWRLGPDLSARITRPGNPNKKVAKALWGSDPIVPQHDPPIGPSQYANNGDRIFFEDFRQFADVVNSWLGSQEYPLHRYVPLPSRFRLQDMPNDEVGLIVSTEGPQPGRCFRLYYNQIWVGRLEIHAYLDYTNDNPEVVTDVEMDWARFIQYWEIEAFSEASPHTSPNPDLRASPIRTLTATNELWLA